MDVLPVESCRGLHWTLCFCNVLFNSSNKNYLFLQKLFEVKNNMIITKENNTLYLRVQFIQRYLR